MKKILIGAMVQVIILVIAGLTGYNIKKPQTVYVDVPYTVIDTVYQEISYSVYKTLPAVHDTLPPDTVYVVPEFSYSQVATMQDSLVSADSVYYGHIKVIYYPRPWDKFNYEFKPAALPTIYVTKYTQKKRAWYENQWLTAAAGLGIGFAAGRLD